jgi:hypothetical protein
MPPVAPVGNPGRSLARLSWMGVSPAASHRELDEHLQDLDLATNRGRLVVDEFMAVPSTTDIYR